MNHRLEKLAGDTRSHGPRIGLVSMYDVENNAVRVLAATLREGGHLGERSAPRHLLLGGSGTTWALAVALAGSTP